MKLAAIFGFSITALVFAQESASPAKVAAPVALVKSSSVEPLIDIASINVTPEHKILLEPGVFALQTADGYAISSRRGSKVQLKVGDRVISLASPAKARWSETGWDLGTGTSIKASSIVARLDEQDDTDNNLKSMQESAKKLAAKKDRTAEENAALKKALVFLFGNSSPFASTSANFDSWAIAQLTHLSAIGD